MKRCAAAGLILICSGFAQADEVERNIPMIERSGDLLQISVPLMRQASLRRRPPACASN